MNCGRAADAKDFHELILGMEFVLRVGSVVHNALLRRRRRRQQEIGKRIVVVLVLVERAIVAFCCMGGLLEAAFSQLFGEEFSLSSCVNGCIWDGSAKADGDVIMAATSSVVFTGQMLLEGAKEWKARLTRAGSCRGRRGRRRRWNCGLPLTHSERSSLGSADGERKGC